MKKQAIPRAEEDIAGAALIFGVIKYQIEQQIAQHTYAYAPRGSVQRPVFAEEAVLHEQEIVYQVLNVEISVYKGSSAPVIIGEFKYNCDQCEEKERRIYLPQTLYDEIAEAYFVPDYPFRVAQHHTEARQHEEKLHHV